MSNSENSAPSLKDLIEFWIGEKKLNAQIRNWFGSWNVVANGYSICEIIRDAVLLTDTNERISAADPTLLNKIKNSINRKNSSKTLEQKFRFTKPGDWPYYYKTSVLGWKI